MRTLCSLLCALSVTLAAQTGHASDYDVLASVFQFFPPGEDDPAPELRGILRIDPATGAATRLIDEDFGLGLFVLSDVAVGPHDGLIYVSSAASGIVGRFNPDGSFVDIFTAFTAGDAADGVSRMRFAADGSLFVSTQSGTVAEFDSAGVRQADRATGLPFPTGLAVSPAGELYVSTGNVGEGSGGALLRLDAGVAPVTLVAPENGFGGGSGLVYRPAQGDYNGDDTTNGLDNTLWAGAYGTANAATDGNGDGVVDAADYTIWRDNLGDESQVLIADFDQSADGNELLAYNVASETSSSLTTIPVAIPDLPPEIMPVPTNAPSEIAVTPEGTLLVSTLGPAQRPLNLAALLEFDFDGNLLRRIDNQPSPQNGLPPISGIALLPRPATSAAVPEPGTVWLAGLAGLGALRGRR